MSAPEFMPTRSPWALNSSELEALREAVKQAEAELESPAFQGLPPAERAQREWELSQLRRQLSLAENELTLSEGQHRAPVASNRAATSTIRAKGKGEILRVETLANGKTVLRTWVSNGHSELCVAERELKPGTQLIVE